MSSGPKVRPDDNPPDKREQVVVLDDHRRRVQPADVPAEKPIFEGGGDDPPPSDVSTSSRRKLDAKRINECLKHFNAFCNTLAAGTLVATAIIPFVKDADTTLDENAVQWCVIALGFHIFPYVLNFLVMQSEG